jgi:hypothetical protein
MIRREKPSLDTGCRPHAQAEILPGEPSGAPAGAFTLAASMAPTAPSLAGLSISVAASLDDPVTPAVAPRASEPGAPARQADGSADQRRENSSAERMDFTELFRQRAAACIEMAKTASDTNLAGSWRRLANEWLMLTEQHPALNGGCSKRPQTAGGE